MNPKDPQAELRMKIIAITSRYGAWCAKHGTGYFEHMPKDTAVVDQIIALFQAHQPQVYKAILGEPPYMTPDGKRSEKEMLIAAAQYKVLSELLGEKTEIHHPDNCEHCGGAVFVEAVPVSAIERKIGELNG